MDPKTVEEILAAMQGLIDGAEGRSLSDDEVTQYEALESKLQSRQKTDELQKRQAAYNTPVTAPLLTTGESATSDPTHPLDAPTDLSAVPIAISAAVGLAAALGWSAASARLDRRGEALLSILLVSPVAVALLLPGHIPQVVVSLTAFTLLYGALAVVEVWLIARFVKAGPPTEEEALADLEPPVSDDGEPSVSLVY